MAATAHQANVTAVTVVPDNQSKPAAAFQDNFAEDKEEFQENSQQEFYNQEKEQPADYTTYMDTVGSNQVTNYYFFDSPHDYYYASRIRRFHRNYAMMGFYDPFFTDMYWYNYNPHYYGMNIYMGYDPFYFPGSYYSWGYRPWGWAHYGYGWGYGSRWGNYWSGHNYGYWDGYHSGYWYGSGGYGRYSYQIPTEQYVFGARRPSDTVTGFGTRGTGRYIGNTSTKIGEQPVGAGSASRPGRFGTTGNTDGSAVNSGRPASATPGNRRGTLDGDARGEQGRREAPGTIGPGTRDRITPADNTSVTSLPNNSQEGQPARPYQRQRAPEDFRNPERVTNNQQTPRYARPQQQTERTSQPERVNPGSATPRTYTSPSQQQPRSNQEYRRPTNEQRPPATGSQQQAAPQRQTPERPVAAPVQRPVQTRPAVTPQRAPQSSPQAAPQRTTPQTRPQAAPTRSAPTQRPQATPQRSAPQRSPQASPARSAPTQRPQAAPSSAPSRSSGSSSGVSRSSSPPSSSGSSSSSGSGGRSSGSSSPGRVR
jgi:uncharacterized membrane protein YgcG